MAKSPNVKKEEDIGTGTPRVLSSRRRPARPARTGMAAGGERPV